jgi:2-oxoglutarate ferredoxin oxidoreductase subunit beta
LVGYALRTGDPEAVLQWIENKSILKTKAEGKSEEELKDKFVLGDFLEIRKPVFQGTTVYKEDNQ